MESLEILAANLKRARKAAKLSQIDAAAKAGISRNGYRKIESAEGEPKPDTLARIAAAVGVSVTDLLRPVEPLRSVRFRARKKMRSREEMIASVSRWLHDYAWLEKELGTQIEFGFASARREGNEAPKEVALKARGAVGLGVEPVRDICGMLEDHGVKVYVPSLAANGFFGLSVSEDPGPAVVVNAWDRITVERRIFTAAHELGHLLLHPLAYVVEQADERAEEEKEADEFAGYFLMPDELFNKEWNEARGLDLVDAVFKIKRMFSVSWQTVLYRIAGRGPDRAEVWQRFNRAYKRKYGKPLTRKTEPAGVTADAFRGAPAAKEPAGSRLDGAAFQEDRLQRLVRQALEDERISISRAAAILDISTSEMRAIRRSWA